MFVQVARIRGEIGCIASHLVLLRHIRKTGRPGEVARGRGAEGDSDWELVSRLRQPDEVHLRFALFAWLTLPQNKAQTREKIKA